MNQPAPGPESTMDCIVVGGCANGVLLRAIQADAQFIQLARPDYIKPLESAFQEHPEVAKESDQYEVHSIGLYNSEENPIMPRRAHVFGIAVVKGETLTWGFSQLVIGYVENVTNKLLANGVIDKQ